MKFGTIPNHVQGLAFTQVLQRLLRGSTEHTSTRHFDRADFRLILDSDWFAEPFHRVKLRKMRYSLGRCTKLMGDGLHYSPSIVQERTKQVQPINDGKIAEDSVVGKPVVHCDFA